MAKVKSMKKVSKKIEKGAKDIASDKKEAMDMLGRGMKGAKK